MTVLHTLSRTALLGTALGLSLAGCATSPVAAVATENQVAAASVSRSAAEGRQYASLENADVMTDASEPVVRKGTVLWRRMGDEAAPKAPEPQVSDELKRLREAVERMQGMTTEQIAALQTKLATNEQALQQVSAEQARQERDLREQTTSAVSNVAKMAEESLRSMRQVTENNSQNWDHSNRQLSQLETRLQTALTDVQNRQQAADQRTQNYTDLKVSQATLQTQLEAVREARRAASEAEQRVKSYTEAQLAAADQAQNARFSAVNTQLAAADQVQNARIAAVNTQLAAADQVQSARIATVNTQIAAADQVQSARIAAVNNQIAAADNVQSARIAAVNSQIAAADQAQTARLVAVSTQLAANSKLTEMQLAELRKVSDENRALASAETASVSAALRIYADRQLAQAQANTASTLAEMATATNQNIAALDERTSKRMGVMWTAASVQAEKLAEQKANAVAASVAALQQQTASQKIEPAQIRAIAEQTMADSTPEFRALALQTLKDGQDYIRSVARSAVQDKDPGMTSALADAARDVITKDDKVVFAIRKAVADELQGIATGGTAPTTEGARTTLGPDHNLSEAEQLDPNRLRIAQLLSPEGGPASDAAKLNDSQLAAISPAAGNAIVAGQQSWSAQGTSLMRARNRADWMDIRQYKVIVHQDDQTLDTMMANILKHAEPFTGPWQIRWKISEPNKDLMTEKFSLDAEAPFEEFVSYLAQYIVNDRGVKLSVSLFDSERIIVISD